MVAASAPTLLTTTTTTTTTGLLAIAVLSLKHLYSSQCNRDRRCSHGTCQTGGISKLDKTEALAPVHLNMCDCSKAQHSLFE